MKRHPQLVLLAWDHHHGLVLALRIGREVTGANAMSLARLYADLLASWDAHLLPHFRVEQECLLARLVRYVPKDDELITRTLGDHLSMAALVATMRDTTDPELRRDSIHRFGETLRAHIRWEEEVLFEVTQRQLDENELTALGREIAERLPDVSHQASVSSLQVANEYDVDGSPLAG
jgi:hemerythrin-like domain-containing protein